MKLMISVISAAEARDAIAGGAEILDVKNPEEGSLGAQAPRVIRDIINIASGKVAVSAAIGDMPNLPGTAALAAMGAAACGADFIKVGVYGPHNESEALILLREVRRAVEEYPVSIVAAGYADFRRAGALDPNFLPRLAARAGIQGCLLDTFIKDGHSLFDFFESKQLFSMAKDIHDAGLIFGLAGNLREQDLSLARNLEADIVGIRSAACRNGRRQGPLDMIRMRRLLNEIPSVRTATSG